MFSDEYEVRCEMTIVNSDLDKRYIQGRATLSKWVDMTDEEDINTIVVGYINFFKYETFKCGDDTLPLLNLAEDVGGNTCKIMEHLCFHYESLDQLEYENSLEFFLSSIVIEDMNLRPEYTDIGLDKHFFEAFREFHDSAILFLSLPKQKFSNLGFIYPENNNKFMLKDGNLI